MSFRKILCPIDFSSGSDHALRVAARLATRHGAELVIAHVWYAGEYSLASYTFPSRAVEQMIDEEQQGLAAAVHEAHQVGAARVRSELRKGDPAQEIVALVRDEPELDLVVMGTRGRSGLARVLLGSVAEQVVRQATCPVLVTREGLDVVPLRRLLCPIDFSEGSRQAMELAARIVEPGGAGITLLHVVELPGPYTREPALRDLGAALEREASRTLEQWASELRTTVGVAVTTRVRSGRLGPELLAALDDEPFDLVVTGSRGQTGIRRALLGSVAEKIVRHAPCPVLLARRREDA
jgi:nucleotide-binding universal stress UspA family protein